MQKQGNTAANKSVVEQRANQGNNRRDTPFSGKEKGDTENDAAVTKGAKDLFKLFLLLLAPSATFLLIHPKGIRFRLDKLTFRW
ncbi:MAG: hypothetical protein IJ992_08500 [Lentisphaeria bacterium]|nr:hypothetical protein [Lentisphaeria bacterium]